MKGSATPPPSYPPPPPPSPEDLIRYAWDTAVQQFSLICDMFAPKRARGPHNFARFHLLGPLHYPRVLSVVFKCFANIRITDQIASLCVHAPRGHIYVRVFVPFRLSSLSMAEAPVAILPYVLEAVRPAAIPPSSYLL